MKIVCGEFIHEKCVICGRGGRVWIEEAWVDLCFNCYLWTLIFPLRQRPAE
jgi:hypothetical protein